MDWKSEIRKEKLLDRGGYRYYIKRMSYVNLEKKKFFTIHWIDEHSADCLAEKVAEPNDSGDWQFYFNDGPPPDIRELLTSELAAIHARRAAR